MKATALSLLTICLIVLSAAWRANARTWTSTDGKSFDGDFVSATAESVTVKRSDGKSFTIPLSRLSEADRKWVGEQAASQPSGSAEAGPPKPIEGPYASLVTGDWALSKFKNLPFALYASKELSADKKYPLVLTLHGKSDNNENGKQIGWAKEFTGEENYSERPCIVVAPLCYQPHGGTGGGWSDKPGDEAIELVKALIESLPVDEARVYVAGYSMGGFGTCHLMAREPRLFAAGVPVAGAGSDYGSLKREPIWLFHAADDQTVNVEGSRQMAEALKRSKTFKYTEFPDGGHGIVGRVFDDVEVHKWLFSQTNG